jgi:hypothetical protein
MLRPVFSAQQNTTDMLRSMMLLQTAGVNRPYWYVLLADQQSYFSPNPPLTSTNRLSRTNAIATAERVRLPGWDTGWFTPALTNTSPARPGLIAELCVPLDSEGARKELSQLVNGLKQQPLFSKADLLSEDLRRNLADPKVMLSDRDFVLALDFAQTDFQQAIRTRKPAPVDSTRNGVRRPRAAASSFDRPEGPPSTSP